eukprot:6044829-Ditylum_brightwellii.AAC.1
MLLSICQEEFEQDTATKIQKATEGIKDEEEEKYEARRLKNMNWATCGLLANYIRGEMTPPKPKEEGNDQKEDNEENED